MRQAKLQQDTNYHRILRIAVVVCAVVVVFESGLLKASTEGMATQAHLYMANAIGMSAGVAPTELNQYTAALTQKERELEAREAAIQEREIAVGLENGATTSDRTLYLLSAILFILLVLIVLNYVLDYLRIREERASATPV